MTRLWRGKQEHADTWSHRWCYLITTERLAEGRTFEGSVILFYPCEH